MPAPTANTGLQRPQDSIFLLVDRLDHVNFNEFPALKNRLDEARVVKAVWSDWNAVESAAVSIPELVEQRWFELRTEYLSWLYDLGAHEVNGVSLRAKLQLDAQEVSYWNLSLLDEKSSLKSHSIYSVFKLRILEKYFMDSACRTFVYLGDDRLLRETLSEWCQTIHVNFEAHFAKPLGLGLKSRLSRKVRKVLAVQVAEQFAFLAKRWLTRVRLARPGRNPAHGPTVVTYFPNVDLDKLKKGEFRSHYWGAIHPVLETLPEQRVNWVWLYSTSAQCNYAEAVGYRDLCNQNSKAHGRFYLLEEFIGIRDLMCAFLKALRLRSRTPKIHEVRALFRFPRSTLTFDRFFEPEWESSFFGRTAIENSLWMELFRKMASSLPARPWGLYLWESQAWERALLSAWRSQGQGLTLASQHSTVRALDLRCFSDIREHSSEAERFRPMPDRLVVNGAGSKKLLMEGNYPATRVAEGEAVRYFSLLGKFEAFKKVIPERERSLLVISGYDHAETVLQLRFLQECWEKGGLQTYSRVLIKSHPDLELAEVLDSVTLSFSYEKVTTGLASVWSQADVAYCANSTSVLMEAAWYGIPAIATGTRDSMNLNPLFGQNNGCFINSGEGLAQALREPKRVPISPDYFYLDSELSGWKKLLTVKN